MTLQDAYRILGLSPDANAAQLKTSYRHLVAQAHPDRGGKAADFIRIRAAYEILSAFLQQGEPDEEIPIPEDLREVIDKIVGDFREQQRWAEAETLRHLAYFEKEMAEHIAHASRADLRRFSIFFTNTWDAVIGQLFRTCNSRCDRVLQRYETWYTKNTQAFFDGMHRREVLHFAFRRRFWEVFVFLVAIAGALSVAIGWDGPWHRWVSIAVIMLAAIVSFLLFWWSARRKRKDREKVEPLSVVVFELNKNARFPTENTLRRGRLTTAALGMAGMFLGNAAAGGLAIPVVGAVAGAAIGGVFDRWLNPVGEMRASMQKDLQRFMAMARPQLTQYVVEAHTQLMDDVRAQVLDNYQERMSDTVKLLTAGEGGKRR